MVAPQGQRLFFKVDRPDNPPVTVCRLKHAIFLTSSNYEVVFADSYIPVPIPA